MDKYTLLQRRFLVIADGFGLDEKVSLMKIAQIAPLAESCPPKLYGGTERVVSYLTEELVAQGHEVTLFASGDSKTSAELVPCSQMALRLNPSVKDAIPYHMLMLEQVRRRAGEFDVIHFHIDVLQFPLIHAFADKTATTLHGRLDQADLHAFYWAFPEVPLVSISYHQRHPLPQGLNWAGSVYHGIPKDLLPFSPRPRDGYLAFRRECLQKFHHHFEIACPIVRVSFSFCEWNIDARSTFNGVVRDRCSIQDMETDRKANEGPSLQSSFDISGRVRKPRAASGNPCGGVAA